ncbi:MAG TPA: 2-hydroxyacid dehydrogenase [Stellaceae bacterium]|nr:2-hydroxyacid dehydrogenase [Stellaceae bacterium]
MKALFLGGVAADTARGIRDELAPSLQVEIIDDPIDRARLEQVAPDIDILVSNHWRPDYPLAPKMRLVQSVATGVELFDLKALPKGCAVCNAFGHETAIAEYVVMAMLALYHRFFQIAGEFRERGSWATSWVQSGAPHGEVRGSTLGIVGYGRVGREVARRAVPFGCRILAANRSPRERDAEVERIYPLAELDRMLPECDTVAVCTALGPETTGLVDAHRIALMKPGAFLINIARGQVVDEDALYAALRGGKLGGAAIDVWWQYPNPAEPARRGSRHPFHELPNVIATPHNSGWTAGMVRRRWDEIAGNINRFERGDSPLNLVATA